MVGCRGQIPTFHHYSWLSWLPPEFANPLPLFTQMPTYYKWWHNTLTALNVSQPQYPSCPSLSPCAESPCPLWTTWTGSSPSQLADFPAVVYNICYETVRRAEQSTTTRIGISNCAVSRAWHCDNVTAEKSLSHGIETVILTKSFLVGKSPRANKPTLILRPVSRLLSTDPGSPSWATVHWVCANCEQARSKQSS